MSYNREYHAYENFEFLNQPLIKSQMETHKQRVEAVIAEQNEAAITRLILTQQKEKEIINQIKEYKRCFLSAKKDFPEVDFEMTGKVEVNELPLLQSLSESFKTTLQQPSWGAPHYWFYIFLNEEKSLKIEVRSKNMKVLTTFQ